MANAGLDDLHRSMGEFLTACAYLENMLWGLLIICDDESTFQDIAKQFLPLTFGERVNLLAKKCGKHRFSRITKRFSIKSLAGLRREIAKAFIKNMRAFHAEPNAIKRDEIAARQMQALRPYQGPREKKPGSWM